MQHNSTSLFDFEEPPTTYKMDKYRLMELVGDVEDPARIYPYRLRMMEKVLRLDTEYWINAGIIDQMKLVADPEPDAPAYEYERDRCFDVFDTLSADKRGWVGQFVGDVYTFGLQEAVVYLGDTVCQRKPDALVGSFAGFARGLAEQYRDCREQLFLSDDDEVHMLLAFGAVFAGERIPPDLTPAGLTGVRRHLNRVAIKLAEEVEYDEPAWSLRFLASLGLEEEDADNGNAAAELTRIYGGDGYGAIHRIFNACVKSKDA